MERINKLSDEQLVVLVREKDQERYKEIVERYQEKLLRFASYLIGSQDKATDVVQESFIKAFVNLQGFDAKKKFSSWIYRIVHNEAINFIKKHKQEISLEKNSWVSQKIKSKQNLEQELEKKETKQRLKYLLDKLELKYREPLILFYFEDKNYEEISDVLRMPIGTVGTRINRGKKLLKVLYEGGNHPA